MRISFVQDSIVWADKKANLRKTALQLHALAGNTDLVVLPEMFSTGFCTNELHLAEGMDGETVASLCEWAVTFGLAICGSFIAVENGNVYNRAFFVTPDGQIQTADKRHLFSMGGEHKHFSAGNKRMIVNYMGFNICVLVCYDLRFPVWSRNTDNAYDLLLYVANFPDKRISSWDILLRARAVENQAYVCGVNRVGMDGARLNYNGHSVLLNYFGEPLLTSPENELSILTYDLQMEPLNRYREKFDVSKDADRFEIQL